VLLAAIVGVVIGVFATNFAVLMEFANVFVVALSSTNTFASNGELDIQKELDWKVKLFEAVIILATIMFETELKIRKL